MTQQRSSAGGRKTALITGVTGQDGAYLAELLLEKGYAVHGLVRRASASNTGRIDHLIPGRGEDLACLRIHYGDMTDGANLQRLIQSVEPDEVYNLAAQSDVRLSFEAPEATADVDALGPLRLLEAIRALGLERRCRFYQASTSELFGKVRETPQSERTAFHPRSPYGVSKLFSYWITVNYREAYGLFASNGILFNHESPRRGENFITRKVTRAAAAIRLGLQERLAVGNLDARRDWGHARDYVRGMWAMLQHETPDDFVLATGETRSVRELIELAFAQAGLRIAWRGAGLEEEGVEAATGRVLIHVDPAFFRPAEVDLLCGDAGKAERLLGWRPEISFEAMIAEMVESDLAALDGA